MKTLYLVRHGKSDWDQLDLSDFDRPLKKRGIKNAREAGSFILRQPVQPDIILSSPARRARDTAHYLRQAMELHEEHIRLDESLYHGDFSVLLKYVLYLDQSWNCVVIVGHEPHLGQLIHHFVPRPPERIVTASVTILRFDADSWMALEPSLLSHAHHANRHDWTGVDLLT